jgi:hypothetical protein
VVNSKEQEEDRSTLERRAKTLFDESVSGLNASVRSRLTQARYAAVAELDQQRESWIRRWGIPAGGLTAAALALGIFVVLDRFPGMGSEGQPAVAALAVEDMAILSDADNLGLLEDMEFYAWLENESASEELDNAPGTTPSKS